MRPLRRLNWGPSLSFSLSQHLQPCAEVAEGLAEPGGREHPSTTDVAGRERPRHPSLQHSLWGLILLMDVLVTAAKIVQAEQREMLGKYSKLILFPFGVTEDSQVSVTPMHTRNHFFTLKLWKVFN